MELTPEEIAAIQRQLQAAGYDEITIERPRMRLTLRRGAAGGWTYEAETLAEPSLVSAAAPEPAGQATGALPPAPAPVRADLVAVHPPLPGAFYRAPKPGAEPFVAVGSQVRVETVIGIIETMKLMNPVPARVAGEIVAICVANGEQVDTSRVLMQVKPQRDSRG